MKDIITRDNGYGTIHKFTKVDKIPNGFHVWNIPEIAPDIIPLCQTVQPNNKDCFDVNTNNLKYITIEPAKAAILREAAHVGAGNLRDCKKRTTRKDTYIRTRATAALPIYEEIEKR